MTWFIRAPLPFYVMQLKILLYQLNLVAYQAFIFSFSEKLSFSKIPKLSFCSFGPSFGEVFTMFRIIWVFVFLSHNMSTNGGVPNVINRLDFSYICSFKYPVAATNCYQIRFTDLFRGKTSVLLKCPFIQLFPQVISEPCNNNFGGNARVVICPSTENGIQTVQQHPSVRSVIDDLADFCHNSLYPFLCGFGECNITGRSTIIWVMRKLYPRKSKPFFTLTIVVFASFSSSPRSARKAFTAGLA